MFLGENDWDIVHITCTGVEEDNFQESANVALKENAMLVQMIACIGDFGALAVTTTKNSNKHLACSSAQVSHTILVLRSLLVKLA